MKVTIPDNLQGKELIDFLITNKAAIIAQKKCLPKMAEAISFAPSAEFYKEGAVVKAATPEEAQEADADMVKVKLVGNACYWCDSHMDVAIPGCYDKSVKERKGMMVHLHDHVHSIEAEVGDVKKVYTENINLNELGLKKAGATECLVFESEVQKSYNPKVFSKYKAGRVKQHSIGLWYIKLELAVNDEDYPKEKEIWDKHINNIINKKYVEDKGFFWAMVEIKVMEVSAVLFGANELTPTLNVKSDTEEAEPVETTPKAQPSFDINKYLQTVKIFD